ncbi:MAG: DoxX family protein [Acidobacteriota bacterium]
MTVFLRWMMAAIFIAGGALHLLKPEIYRPVMPGWLPAHGLLILVSGVAEIAGGAGLLSPRTRRAAGVGLMLLLVAVFPANIEMLRVYRAQAPWWGTLLLWLRLPLQAVLIWLTWRVARQPARAVRAPAGERSAD